MKQSNWGIISPGGIARKFALALNGLDQGVSYAVASRTQRNADAFASEFGYFNAYSNYQQMLTDPELDAVYIASPHHAHMQMAIDCLNAGKAVLCEKPIAVNTAQTRTIFAAATANNSFCMEAVWTRFLPIYQTIRDWLIADEIGDVRLLQFNFGLSLPFKPEHRLFNPALAGGSILDLGIYPVTLADWVFDCAPKSIQASGTKSRTGVDDQMVAVLDFGDGRFAQIGSGLHNRTSHAAWIIGTKGRILIHEPAHGSEAATLIKDDSLAQDIEVKLPHHINGYAFEIEEVHRCLSNGDIQSLVMPWQSSLRVMAVLDELRSQLGVRYDFE